MNKNYADVLESYLIAEEGSLKEIGRDLWKNASAGQKTVMIAAPIALAAGVVSAGISRYRAKNNDKKNNVYYDNTRNDDDKKNNMYRENTENNDDNRNKVYYENTKNVIARMYEECPEIIQKELDLRKSELRAIIKIIDNLARKYKIGGFKISSNVIKEYLRNPENYDDCDCRFIQDILPYYNPRIYNLYLGQWNFDCRYYVEAYSTDIYDWNKLEKENSIENLREYDDTREYWDVIAAIDADIKNACAKFKCFLGIGDGGDWDGTVGQILLKPSDEFIRVAETYGYYM